MDRYDALTRYNYYNKLYNSEKLVSSADLKVSLTANQLDELLTTLHDRHLNDEHLTERQREFTHQAITTLQAVQASMTTNTVEILIEAITDNYGRLELEHKENCSVVMNTPIIYFAG